MMTHPLLQNFENDKLKGEPNIMEEKKYYGRIIHKHDIESNWIKAVNFIPKNAELIVYDPDDNYSYPRIKIGDGVTPVNELPFTIEQVVEKIFTIMSSQIMPTPKTISLLGGDAWTQIGDNMYTQNITEQLEGLVTENSKIDLQPTPEQLAIFHEKDVTFTVVNEDCDICVYAIGIRPEHDYENIQITITEVLTNV